MNIIIAGCGKVGQKITEKLSAESNLDITVVDLKGDIINNVVSKYDAMGIPFPFGHLPVPTGAEMEALSKLLTQP